MIYLWASLYIAALIVVFLAGYGLHAWREPRERRGELIDLTGRR